MYTNKFTSNICIKHLTEVKDHSIQHEKSTFKNKFDSIPINTFLDS